MVQVHLCKVTDPNGLHIRAQPTTTSAIIWTAAPGTTLNYYEVVQEQDVGGNPYWGHSVEDHYYWMGGTDYAQN